jgi:hypothetical protein
VVSEFPREYGIKCVLPDSRTGWKLRLLEGRPRHSG